MLLSRQQQQQQQQQAQQQQQILLDIIIPDKRSIELSSASNRRLMIEDIKVDDIGNEEETF